MIFTNKGCSYPLEVIETNHNHRQAERTTAPPARYAGQNKCRGDREQKDDCLLDRNRNYFYYFNTVLTYFGTEPQCSERLP